MAHTRPQRAGSALPPEHLTWAALEAALGPQAATERPEGSVTVDEFAERRGICTSRASAILRKLSQDGVLRCVPFRGPTGKTLHAYLAVPK